MTLRDRIGIDIGRKLKLEAAIDWAVANDVKIVDVCLDGDPEMLRDGGGGRADAARRRLEGAGLRLGLHTLSAVNVAETSPYVSEAVDRYLEAYIDACKRLGAGWIVVHGGFHFTSDRKQRLAASAARLDRAATYAEKAGATLLLENLNKEPDDAEVHYIPFALDETRWYFEQLRSPAVRWSFTANHAHLVPEGIAGFVDGMDMSRCGEVRLADCRGTIEEHLQIGEGTIDFAAMFAKIEGAGYRGHYTNAFGSLDDMLKGRERLVEIAADAGIR